MANHSTPSCCLTPLHIERLLGGNVPPVEADALLGLAQRCERCSGALGLKSSVVAAPTVAAPSAPPEADGGKKDEKHTGRKMPALPAHLCPEPPSTPEDRIVHTLTEGQKSFCGHPGGHFGGWPHGHIWGNRKHVNCPNCLRKLTKETP